MTLTPHRFSRQDFAALASGSSGLDAVRELASVEYSKHMTFLWGVVDAAEGREKSLARAGYDLLTAALRKDYGSAGTVIRYPSVGAWARRAVQALHSGSAMPGSEPGQLLAVAAAAAIRAGLPAEIEVPVTGGRVMLPTLGTALVPDRTTVLRCGPDGATIGQVRISRDHPGRDSPGWLGLRRVRVDSLDVLVDDLDPFRMPGMQDLMPRRETSAWDPALRGSWRVLEHGHSGVASEVATLISAIVPLRPPPSGEVSTTSPEAFGAVALSLPSNPVSGAVTLVHEIQHLKLGALLDLVTLTRSDDGRRYYAPWRDDPRPLAGLLQGAYAYLGVSAFWRRQRRLPGKQLQADSEYARWRAETALAVETLRSSGRLTHAGLEFVGAMARTLGKWQDEPVPAGAVALARRAAESHRSRWQSAHGPVSAG
jgi:HEXXH motif-containing protein